MDKLKQTQLRDEQHKLREMEMALGRQLINEGRTIAFSMSVLVSFLVMFAPVFVPCLIVFSADPGCPFLITYSTIRILASSTAIRAGFLNVFRHPCLVSPSIDSALKLNDLTHSNIH
jgi:hypothetical protein